MVITDTPGTAFEKISMDIVTLPLSWCGKEDDNYLKVSLQ